MKLYASLTSPYARKVRIALLEKGVPFEFVPEGPTDPAGNVARLNPLGKVPLLVRDDGEVLFDSPFIVDYIDTLPGIALIPATGETRWQAQRWHALGQGIVDAVVARLLESRRSDAMRDAGVIAQHEDKIAAALAWAEARLPAASFLIDNRYGIADIALGVALEYIDLRYAHDWRSDHPRLAQWLAPISGRSAFMETRAPG